MISVTATEFQQRTGYYFDLVDKGVEVEIRKMKPKGQVYRLVKGGFKKKKTDRMTEIVNDLNKLKFYGVPKMSGIDYQKKVRS